MTSSTLYLTIIRWFHFKTVTKCYIDDLFFLLQFFNSLKTQGTYKPSNTNLQRCWPQRDKGIKNGILTSSRNRQLHLRIYPTMGYLVRTLILLCLVLWCNWVRLSLGGINGVAKLVEVRRKCIFFVVQKSKFGKLVREDEIKITKKISFRLQKKWAHIVNSL